MAYTQTSTTQQQQPPNPSRTWPKTISPDHNQKRHEQKLRHIRRHGCKHALHKQRHHPTTKGLPNKYNSLASLRRRSSPTTTTSLPRPRRRQLLRRPRLRTSRRRTTPRTSKPPNNPRHKRPKHLRNLPLRHQQRNIHKPKSPVPLHSSLSRPRIRLKPPRIRTNKSHRSKTQRHRGNHNKQPQQEPPPLAHARPTIPSPRPTTPKLRPIQRHIPPRFPAQIAHATRHGDVGTRQLGSHPVQGR